MSRGRVEQKEHLWLVHDLTNREQGVFRLMAEGMTNKEIAEEVGISKHSIRIHMKALYKKLDISNRNKLIIFAYRIFKEK